MAITLSIGQEVQLSAVPKANGAKVPVVQTGQGEPVWTVDDATKVTLTPSQDGETCKVKGKAAGAATVTCTQSTSGGDLTATQAFTVSGPGGNVADELTIVAGSVTGP